MVYNYTRPRKPVMGSYSGPGPCYGLPGLLGERCHDPRSIHAKGPGYSFGLKHGKYTDNCSPGPCYSLDKMYRNGREETPKYSMVWRPKSAPLYQSPGPAAYARERSTDSSHYRAPAYHFGVRSNLRKTDRTPGPNAYDTLDRITVVSGKRSAPAYTMVGKQYQGSFYQDRAKTPGPSAYNTPSVEVYKTRPPGYSIVGKNVIPGDTTRKPGPGAHSPERGMSPKRSAPSFTFGLRHSQYTAPLIVDPLDS